jgi:diacylglycerol kinase family enzyme
LAILPGGTANVLARELRLPLNVRAAARKIPTSAPRRLSLGRAGSRYFLLMAGIGFDAAVVRRINGSSKRLFGMATYVVEALKFLVSEAPPRFSLVTAKGRREFTFVCISKSKHYGPIRMVQEADLFSDQFTVYCFPSESRFRYLLYAWAAVTGTTAQLPDVERVVTRTAFCEPNGSHEEIFLQVDGELAGQLPCAIEIVPDALTLLVPDTLSHPDPAVSRIRLSMTGISKAARLRSAAAFVR